jgi:hypothetical protein
MKYAYETYLKELTTILIVTSVGITSPFGNY